MNYVFIIFTFGNDLLIAAHKKMPIEQATKYPDVDNTTATLKTRKIT